jgi:hypothetical protein
MLVMLILVPLQALFEPVVFRPVKVSEDTFSKITHAPLDRLFVGVSELAYDCHELLFGSGE